MRNPSSVKMARIHDSAKGPFDPRNLAPQDGVLHPGKTEQDNLPVSLRPRVKAAQARLAAMR